MTTTTTTTTAARTKRHPIRGFLYGIPFGLGIAMIAVGQKWAALGTWPPFILFVVGVLVSMVWSTFGPAKAPKDPPPVGASTPEPPPEPEPDLAPISGPDDEAMIAPDEGSTEADESE